MENQQLTLRELRGGFHIVVFRMLPKRYVVGNGKMIPQLDPRIVFTGFLETVGRIVSHAFILVGMFPVNICKASWHLMLTGTVSTETIMISFLGHMTEREMNVIEKVIEGKVLSDIDAL